MRFVKFMVMLGALSGSIRLAGAADLAMNSGAISATSPYAPIVARNIFGLLPIPTNPPVDPNAKPVTPPPKITPNGTMTLFGVPQALFKVSWPPAGGQPAKDQSYVLAEGESQDNIEVTKIDEVAAIITFNNNGEIQELPLAAAPKITTPASPITTPGGGGIGGGPAPMGGGIPRPVLGGGGLAAMRARMAAANNAQNPGDAGSGGGAGSAYGASSTAANPNVPGGAETAGLSSEAQVMLIEQERLNTQEQVNNGQLPPLPITPITPADATGAGGEPLINNPEPGTSSVRH